MTRHFSAPSNCLSLHFNGLVVLPKYAALDNAANNFYFNDRYRNAVLSERFHALKTGSIVVFSASYQLSSNLIADAGKPTRCARSAWQRRPQLEQSRSWQGSLRPAS
jgi:hypothetical protein